MPGAGESVKLCGERATYSRSASSEDAFDTVCLAEPGHEGPHVYAQLGTGAGQRDETSFVRYYGEDGRGLLFMDLVPGERFNEVEAATAWQYMEAVRAAKRRKLDLEARVTRKRYKRG